MNTTAVHPANVVLLGCGAVSERYYAPALTQLQRQKVLRVAALYDPNANASQRLSRWFPRATILERADDLRGVQLAIIASPPQCHAEQTITCLNAGVAVLCEKPMALSFKEASAMMHAATGTQQLLAVALVRRFLPAAQTIRAILQKRLLGEIRSVTCFEGGPFRWPARSTLFFDRCSGGGVLADIGPHVLDLLIWWLGTPADLSCEDDAIGGVDANCRIIMKYPAGFDVDIRLSRDWQLPNQYFFDLTRGSLSWSITEPENVHIILQGTPFVLNAQLHCQKIEFRRRVAGARSFNFEQSFIEQIRNVIGAIAGTERPATPGEEAVESVRLLDECYRRRTLMRMEWLTEPEQAEAQRTHAAGTSGVIA